MPAPAHYIVLVRGPGEDSATPLAEAMAGLAHEPGWRQRMASAQLAIWTRGEGLDLTPLPGEVGVVLGDLQPMPGAPSGLSPLAGRDLAARDPDAVARALLRAHWGRYVAILGDEAASPWVLRDPSGELECCRWTTREGLGVVASDLTAAPGWLRPPRLALDWDAIGLCLAAPAGATALSLLDDVRIVPPGGLSPVHGEDRGRLAWDPARFCAPAALDDAAAARELLARVDACVVAAVAPYERLLVDLSGGLDSSIVAGALAAGGAAGRVAQWVHRVDDRPEGDERAYARAVTDRLGAALTVVRKPPASLTPEDFAELASSFWPGLNGADAARDRDMAHRLDACQAGAIVSGQGGDAVFYQMPTAWVASEEVRRRGPAALGSRVLVDTARRLHKPVWSVYREARAGLRRGAALPKTASSLMPPALRDLAAHAVHPWETAARDLPLARQLQVSALANTHVVRGDCRRRRRGALVFPLAAQPILELCLSIPAATLAAGIQDRPFARAALAARLPDVVRRRRSKGSLTAYFSRLVAASRETLLPYLRDGCLAEAGFLDRAAVERAFDPAHLIQGGRPNDVLNAAPVEAWVRYWQGRAPDSPRAPRRLSEGL
jgi:asparagine synthase (glutamine-hydrolysing)